MPPLKGAAARACGRPPLRGRVESASVDAGALAVYVAKPDDTHHILILMFALPEDGDRVSREVRGPWMGQNIVPLLGRDTERGLGELIASPEG